ncbi:DUF2905 family protein [Geothermobacter ehrlichii]|uniref:DUF2905 family protein n=1 Tax=Geothermobacter ehrlichii TaxID=213224 RepID=A0A5D3WLC0_9BACT|nr:DUF2905 domain-containing protein [Geothermobacter ehrlichii]TYO98303.1 DUF2905 family protein [Geothermobacter ehrlichii]
MHPGKLLLIAGGMLMLAGLLLLLADKLPLPGRLPGDIRIEKENFTFYFPLGSCLLLSLLLSLFLWLFRR